MIGIYEKEDLKKLPDFVWNVWLEKIKVYIITGRVIPVIVRIGVTDIINELQMLKDLNGCITENDQNPDEDALFYQWFRDDPMVICFVMKLKKNIDSYKNEEIDNY